MIQTQLLKADKPYQIICAAGMVGVQVATLIVTEDKMAADGSYQIDTHSHPVVNYGNKEGLREDLKYRSNYPPNDEYKYFQRLQPEGAVWNKVEIRDIRVLGLAGADNPPVDIDSFIYMIPQVFYTYPSDGVPNWDGKTSSKIINLRFGLERVGITFRPLNLSDRDGNVYIYLTIDRKADFDHMIKVLIREASEYDPREGEISFRVRLDKDNPVDSQLAIIGCIRELDNLFIKSGDKLRFVYRQSAETKDSWDDLLERCTQHMNSLGWKNRYGIG